MDKKLILKRAFDALVLLEKAAETKKPEAVERIKPLFSSFEREFVNIQEHSIEHKIEVARNEFYASVDEVFDEDAQMEAFVRGKFLVKEIEQELKKKMNS